MTAAQFIALVAEAQPKSRQSIRTATQDAYWYIAYQMAREFGDCTTKDLAEMITEGGFPRMNTEEDMQAWLDNEAEVFEFGKDEESDGGLTVMAHYRAKLRQWFA